MEGLRIFNTLTGRKEEFVPLVPGEVRMYVCGVTVYDLSHLGHARAYISFDAVARYLRHLGYRVTYVRNFTDIDDKIIKKACQEGVSTSEIAERYIAEYKKDMEALHVRPVEHEPRATAFVPQMISFISRLVEKGHAYEAGGDVYFAVESFRGYGGLSKRRLEEMEAGARVEVDERKRHPLDFALWKASKENEPWWESPWGHGRPGWHIECSVMSSELLGDTFDIHGGGKDLVFPHHENEIAQSEACSGHPFVKYWMHNGFLNIDEEKMSKSLGNFFTIRDILARFHPQVIRYFMLTTHYRSPLNFSDSLLEEAGRRVGYLYESLARAQAFAATGAGLTPDAAEADQADEVLREFREAMNDDFNTAAALGGLSGVFRRLNELVDAGARPQAAAAVLERVAAIADVLGVLDMDPARFAAESQALRRSSTAPTPEEIDELLRQRQAARGRKEWAEADRIRDQLLERGVEIKDARGTTEWRYR